MRRKEYELFPPVRDWLASRGYEIHVEIFDADVVAVKDGQITAIELKPQWTRRLLEQMQVRATWADFVMGAVFATGNSDVSKSIRRGGMKYLGFGMLVVDELRAKQVLKPQPQPFMWHKRHAYRLKKLGGRLPAQEYEMAGLPACPALREQRLLRNDDE